MLRCVAVAPVDCNTGCKYWAHGTQVGQVEVYYILMISYKGVDIGYDWFMVTLMSDWPVKLCCKPVALFNVFISCFKVPNFWQNIPPNGVNLTLIFQNFSASEGGTSPIRLPPAPLNAARWPLRGHFVRGKLVFNNLDSREIYIFSSPGYRSTLCPILRSDGTLLPVDCILHCE